MAVKIPSRLIGTVTQGSSDAFAQAEIPTALLNVPRTAYQVTRILFEAPIIPGASGAEVTLSLTRNSKSAIPTLADRMVIEKYKYEVRLTTSGAVFQQPVIERRPGEGVIIVEDPLYVQIDSSSTSAANTGIVVIEYFPVTLTDAEKLQLLQQTIAAS